MNQKLKALTAALLSIPFSLTSLTCAAKESVKNWDYYFAMTDYDVYCAYCQAKDITPAETLPDQAELPCCSIFMYHGDPALSHIVVSLGEADFTEAAEMSHREDASYYGFPAAWISDEKQKLRVDTLGGVVTFHFDDEMNADLVNAYRIELTLLNSEFAKEYPIEYVEAAKPVEPTPQIYGDFNHDGIVNASDASIILIYAAAYGAGTFSGTFEEYVNR